MGVVERICVCVCLFVRQQMTSAWRSFHFSAPRVFLTAAVSAHLFLRCSSLDAFRCMLLAPSSLGARFIPHRNFAKSTPGFLLVLKRVLVLFFLCFFFYVLFHRQQRVKLIILIRQFFCVYVCICVRLWSSFIQFRTFIFVYYLNIYICSKDSPSQCFQGLLKCEETITVLLLFIGSTWVWLIQSFVLYFL